MASVITIPNQQQQLIDDLRFLTVYDTMENRILFTADKDGHCCFISNETLNDSVPVFTDWNPRHGFHANGFGQVAIILAGEYSYRIDWNPKSFLEMYIQSIDFSCKYEKLILFDLASKKYHIKIFQDYPMCLFRSDHWRRRTTIHCFNENWLVLKTVCDTFVTDYCTATISVYKREWLVRPIMEFNTPVCKNEALYDSKDPDVLFDLNHQYDFVTSNKEYIFLRCHETKDVKIIDIRHKEAKVYKFDFRSFTSILIPPWTDYDLHIHGNLWIMSSQKRFVAFRPTISEKNKLFSFDPTPYGISCEVGHRGVYYDSYNDTSYIATLYGTSAFGTNHLSSFESQLNIMTIHHKKDDRKYTNRNIDISGYINYIRSIDISNKFKTVIYKHVGIDLWEINLINPSTLAISSRFCAGWNTGSSLRFITITAIMKISENDRVIFSNDSVFETPIYDTRYNFHISCTKPISVQVKQASVQIYEALNTICYCYIPLPIINIIIQYYLNPF